MCRARRGLERRSQRRSSEIKARDHRCTTQYMHVSTTTRREEEGHGLHNLRERTSYVNALRKYGTVPSFFRIPCVRTPRRNYFLLQKPQNPYGNAIMMMIIAS